MEKAKSEAIIEDYSIQQTSLEQVRRFNFGAYFHVIPYNHISIIFSYRFLGVHEGNEESAMKISKSGFC